MPAQRKAENAKEFRVQWGNPRELESKIYGDASRAKQWGRGKLSKFNEFAAKFNKELSVEIQTASKEIDELNLGALPIGDQRGWAVTDELSGTTMVVRLERIS